jgi:hypothetical protein
MGLVPVQMTGISPTSLTDTGREWEVHAFFELRFSPVNTVTFAYVKLDS